MSDPIASNVVDLDEQRPHIVLDCTGVGGAVHVINIRLAMQWASGKAPLPQDEILRRIILDWLCMLADIDIEPTDDGPRAA